MLVVPALQALLAAGSTALLGLLAANPGSPLPLHELALMGAKEIALYGLTALSVHFNIFAWLLGTGAEWNGIRLAEKAKRALGSRYHNSDKRKLYMHSYFIRHGG